MKYKLYSANKNHLLANDYAKINNRYENNHIQKEEKKFYLVRSRRESNAQPKNKKY